MIQIEGAGNGKADLLPVMILGPTASGKSELALGMAQSLGGEIINADAMQVYRGLDIGTGKIPAKDRLRIPHHLLDVLEPGAVFSAGEFRRRTLACIDEIRSRGKRPILVGGTGFYLRALAKSLAPIAPVPGSVRESLNTLMRRRGTRVMHRMLEVLDPPAALKIAPSDRQRIERALEVMLASGRRFSSQQEGEMTGGDRLLFLKIGLNLPRPVLWKRIEERVGRMVAEGWLEEVGSLLAQGVSPEAHAMKSIGYREMAQVVEGLATLETATELIITRTRQFAKRQMTWFRREEGIFWVDGLVAEIAGRASLNYIRDKDKEKIK